MKIKLNNGNTAILCSKCNIIIDQNISSEVASAYKVLYNKGIKWYCSACSPRLYTQEVQHKLFNLILKQITKKSINN